MAVQADASRSMVRRAAEALCRREGAATPALEQVEAELASLLKRARDAWPELDLGDERFLDHLAARLGAEQSLLSDLSALYAPDLFLAAACASHHPKALAEFERLYIAEVPRALMRLRPSSDFVEEVQQTLRERLLVPRGDGAARIADYSGRGPLGAWVRVAALRTALSLRRARKETVDRPELSERVVAVAVAEPDAEEIRRRYRDLLKSAVQQALASLSDDDRSLLRHHVIDGLTVAELGAMHGVHGSTISRRISRIRGAVLDEARRLVSSAEQLRESEFRSVVRVLRTDLDVSIERVLAPDR